VAVRQVDSSSHVVQFYEREGELVDSVAPYLLSSLRTGGTAVVIATEAHRRDFDAALGHAGFDAAAAIAAGSLVVLDAADTLAKLMTDGRLDTDRFDAEVGTLVRDLASIGPVSAYGEMVAVLWEQGQVGAAVELESLWNGLAEKLPFSLLCAYPLDSVGAEDQIAQLHAVCHLHTDVLGGVDPAGRGVSSRHFEGTVGVTAARHFVLGAIAVAGLQRIADEIAIVVTELATNAVIHARSVFAVTVLIQEDTVRVAVRDHSTAFPQPREAAPTALGGRGLGLVGAVARWGVEAVTGGKTVWAELHG